MKIISFKKIIFFLFLVNVLGISAQTVTKTYSGGIVTVDGETETLPGVVFAASDFPSGCVVESVSVIITWNKTDGSCASPNTGNSYHNETGFIISGPIGNTTLAATGTWSGSTSINNVTTAFNSSGGSPSGTPVSGSFGAPGLSSYIGDNPIGTWSLIGQDTANQDPLCIISYTVAITVTNINANAGPNITLCEGETTNLSATANGTGLTYSWDNGLGAGQTQSFVHTKTGGDGNQNVNYTVTVTDANGCTDTDVVRVTYRSAPDVTVTKTDSECNQDNGTITFSFLDNTARTNIEFSLDNQASYESPAPSDASGSVTYSSLAPGTYNIWTRWGNNQCPVDLGSITIDEVDTTAPVAPTIADETFECSGTPTTPTTTDACDPATINGTTTTTFPITTLGTTVVTWTFTDASGNSTTANQNVIVQDTTAPVTPTIADETFECSGTPTTPTTTDACDPATINGTTTTTFPITTLGTTVVTWTFTDASGNSTTADQNVIVQDTTAPVTPTIADEIFECSGTPTTPTTTDACDPATINGTTTTTFPITTLGTTVVTWTFTDASGNSTTADQNVIVQDTTAPVTPTIADETFECSGTPTTPTTTDACDPATINGTTTTTFPITTLGTTVVTWTFTDASGNSTTANQNIIIQDTTAPVTPTIADETFECSGTPTTPTTTDACDPATINGTTTTTFPITTLGTTVVTWTFTDASGNSTTANQNVIIQDTTAPVTPTIADETFECSGTPTTPTTTDACDPATINGTTTTTFPITTLGTTVVTWTFTDASGNSTTANQNVIVQDTTAPVTPTIADETFECSGTPTTPTTTDACDPATINGTTTTTFPITTLGTTVVTWTFTDASGNSTTADQNVIVQDTTAPVTPTIADEIFECSGTPTTPTTTDACDPATINGTTTTTFPITTLGTTVVTWTFTDASGNSTTANQNIIIQDTTAPVTPTIADETFECSGTPTTPTTTDACDPATINGTTTTTFPITTLGTTVVTWTFTDASGNSTTANQNVIVQDTTAPVTPTIADETFECSGTPTTPTTTDACDPATINGTTTTTFPITTLGTTVVTWTFTDASGNSTTANQNVIVQDTTAPVTPTIADETFECSGTPTTPTTTDACDPATINGTTTTTFPITTLGTTVVTWTFTDASGNSTTANQNVIIQDTTAPVTPTIADETFECSGTPTTPTTTDACDPATINGTTTTTFPITTLGTTVVTWTFTDASGNSTTANQNVIVQDTTAPVTPTIADETFECSGTPTTPTTTDACDPATINGTTTTTFPITTLGTTVVTWTFTDASGNSTTADQNVIVQDTTAPVTPTIADEIFECSGTPTTPTTTDACDPATINGTTTTTFPITTLGTTVVTWTFTDASGNSTTANQNIIIQDTTAPVTPTIADETFECSGTPTTPTTTDACDPATINGTTTTTFPITTLGTTVVTWTFTDASGNSTTANQNVIVQDTTAPVTPTIADETFECSGTPTTPTTTDACDPATINGTTTTTFPITTLGTTVVTWTFTDASGNSTTANQNVIVQDTTAPVTPTIADETFECSGTPTTPTTTDACDPATINGTTTTTFPITTLGTTVVTWTFTDASGNSTTADQNVIVQDTTAPVTPTIADETFECSGTPTTPTTTDACDPATINGTTTTTFPITTLGTTVVTWTFTDASGNSTTANQNVIIQDTTAPVTPTIADETFECSGTPTTPTTTDACDPATINGTTTTTFPITTLGTTVVTWTFTDASGNSTTANQNVIVQDTTAPVTPTIADETFECSGTPTTPTTTDACDPATINGTTTTTFPITTLGTTVVTWTFTDASGNSTTANQNVIVQDTTAPVTPTIADETFECSGTPTTPTTTDACDPATINGTTTTTFPITTLGTTVVTWTFTDASGNSTTANQNVIVQDTTAPVTPTIADETFECSGTPTTPTTTDACDPATINGTTTTTFPITTLGTTVVTWTFTDASGNSTTANQNVIIQDTTAPVTPTIADETFECSGTPTTPTTTDACDPATINGTTTTTFPITTLGTTVVTWTFTDASGNSTTANQNVIIQDTTAPVTPTIADETFECSGTPTTPTTTDACDPATINGTTTTTFPITTLGTTVVTWTFTDASGNSTTANQNVIIQDTTAPVTPTIADEIFECSGTPTTPTTTDACDPATINGTTTTTFPITTLGTTVVTWTFTDASGNSTTANQNVIVQDTTAPVTPTIADETFECSGTPTTPTTTDGCDPATINGTTTTTFPITTLGTTVVTWTFTDASGNSTTANQNVIVQDTTAPVTPTIADETFECSGTPTTPTTTDGCDPSTINGTTTTTFPITTLGTTVVTWTFTDASGNSTTANQNVIIQDTTAPVTPTIADETFECSGTPTTPTTTDACDPATINGTTTTTFPITTLGTTVVTWTFTDASGNSTTANQNVIVQDTTAPVTPTIADETFECSGTPTTPTTTDACDPATINGTTTTTFPITTLGTTVVTWTFTDASGNSTTANQNVIVQDTTAPVTPTIADETFECSGTPTTPTTTDGCDPSTINGTTTTTFPITTLGTTVVTWTFTDASGNSTTANQNVIIQDTTAPVTPTIADETFECSGTPTTPTTTDACDPATINGTTTTTFPITTLGTTVVTWTFTDASGNSTTANQNVIVQDTTAPVTPTIADETFECSGTPTTPTTTDACDPATINGTTTTTFPITTLGTTVVTWTFTDASGNSTTANQNVIVTSCTADLSITKTVNNAIVKVGDRIIYTVRLKNDGPEEAFGVQVTDILPFGLQYDASNSIIPAGTTYNTITNIWDLSNITVPNGQTIELKIAAIVARVGTITNVSEVTQNNQLDPDSTPNSGN
ncbi:hypothetical protein LPB136_04765 [Tenacibaculum todarodis]|uniref:PKD domain-containing protein n=1 Tax=Tenacibaculum todarodis TaxID=1850252 RepID=A0A1L3JI12_9FLAO|nr:DUF11 domain-containing protein [Tenacibaculum todarodis]APG64713.1 hypothetical protein LPB136_04765 [Tenacibaculum todarodis]